MVTDVHTKSLSAEPFEQHVGNITDMNNSKTNYAEGNHSSDEQEIFLAGSILHFHTDFIKEFYCLRKISTPWLKKSSIT